jgi:hypothetical protein
MTCALAVAWKVRAAGDCLAKLRPLQTLPCRNRNREYSCSRMVKSKSSWSSLSSKLNEKEFVTYILQEFELVKV